MFQDMLSSAFGGGDRRKKFMEMAQQGMKNPEAMKAIGAMAGGEGAAGAEGGGLASILGGGMKRPELGPGGTGGFAGNEGLPKIGGQVGSDSGLINRPQPMQNQMPPMVPQDTPKFEPIRDSVNINARLGGPVGGSDTLGALMQNRIDSPAEISPQQTQMIAPRPIAPVRPPDFLGRKGATMEDTPMNHERYGYQTEYMQDGKIPRRWQDILANTLHGASQGMQQTGDWAGALGGAAAGGIGSAVSPIRARDFRFNKEQVPRLERDRKELERGQDRSFELKKRGADVAGTEARTAATIAGTKDAELERRKLDSLIKLNEAKRQAVASGQAKVVEIEDENGQIRIVRVNNDGSVDLGASGRAAMNEDRIESREKISGNQIKSREGIVDKQIGSREKIVGIQQRGATGRTGMTQAGADRRQRERLGAGGEAPNTIPYGPDIPPQGKAPAVGTIPTAGGASGGSERRKAIIQRAIDAGYTAQQAAAEADKRGIK